jgi:hypothetical protein
MQAMNRSTLLVTFSAAVLAAHPVAAQDPPRVGLVMAFPAAIGVVWNVSDRVTVRPEAMFVRSSSESTFTLSTLGTTTASLVTTDSWQVGAGASALFYLGKPDALRTYVTPRFAYTRSNSSSPTIPGISLADTVASNYLVSGSFGAQFAVGRRFGVFGETGLAYTRSRASAPGSSIARPDTTSTSVGLRGGAGVVLYFGS